MYIDDKKWVDRFEFEIRQICGPVFIKPAPKRIDCEEATDLLVLEIGNLTVGCRVRRNYYYQNPKYRGQFTIRDSRPSKKTELQKILEGWQDYNFYGFADETDTSILQWFVGDLKVFRYEYQRALSARLFGDTNGIIKWVPKIPNEDGSSTFSAFDLNTFPKRFIKDANFQVPYRQENCHKKQSPYIANPTKKNPQFALNLFPEEEIPPWHYVSKKNNF